MLLIVPAITGRAPDFLLDPPSDPSLLVEEGTTCAGCLLIC